MTKKPFFNRLVEIYHKTYKEPDWDKILKKTKEEKKNENKTTKIL